MATDKARRVRKDQKKKKQPRVAPLPGGFLQGLRKQFKTKQRYTTVRR